uniref:Uncharacterized protein n=1 Tax=Arundo donax TaxID=35708 RepID=A0A0A9AF22_ARUDO
MVFIVERSHDVVDTWACSIENARVAVLPNEPSAHDNKSIQSFPLILLNFLDCLPPPVCKR